ncbi:DNA adenine methylase [Salinimicrobium soli]|uniref:DNA adenine methylase n=1 Tax=Salinimicrobium soli TaxID=1254399 RepID=UPI003AB03494
MINKVKKGEKKIYFKSPLNYIGGKYKLLGQIIPKIPNDINVFFDLFAGGCNVAVNIPSKQLVLNDNIRYLIDLYKFFYEQDYDSILNHIESRIEEFQLSKTNENGYKELRRFYNQNRNPLDLFVLVAFSFNHQIRYNKKHEFNNPFGRDRSSFNPTMKNNLENFVTRLKEKKTHFLSQDFDQIDYSFLGKQDFVYCDPPYLITTGTYNDGKRGFTGWSTKEETNLYKILNNLNSRGVRFALSNVLEHKGLENTILMNWLSSNGYYIHHLNKDYSNSNYQLKDKKKNNSSEVLITNYS